MKKTIVIKNLDNFFCIEFCGNKVNVYKSNMLLNGKELFDFIFSKIEYSEKLEFEYKIENESQNENEKRIINEIKKILDEIVDGINKKFKLNEDNFDPNDL